MILERLFNGPHVDNQIPYILVSRQENHALTPIGATILDTSKYMLNLERQSNLQR